MSDAIGYARADCGRSAEAARGTQTLAPTMPLVLMSTISTIDLATSAVQAKFWQAEIEAFYDAHFGQPDPTWNWDDVHELDRDALVELAEITDAAHFGRSLLPDVLGTFSNPQWRDLAALAAANTALQRT